VLEIVGQPPTVLVLAPSAQTDKSVVQGGVVEDPDNVARPIDSQVVTQAAPLTDQRRESLGGAITDAVAHRRAPLPLAPTNGNLGLPADLLITADGSVAAVKYGGHAYDQWSVDELLDLASGFGRGART
jgi:hypothetical protein